MQRRGLNIRIKKVRVRLNEREEALEDRPVTFVKPPSDDPASPPRDSERLAEGQKACGSQLPYRREERNCSEESDRPGVRGVEENMVIARLVHIDHAN